jgi:hypothetical protein
MLLERIAIETPEVTAALFERGDTGKPLINLIASRDWMRHYGAPADWLKIFLQDALDDGTTGELLKALIAGSKEADPFDGAWKLTAPEQLTARMETT